MPFLAKVFFQDVKFKFLLDSNDLRGYSFTSDGVDGVFDIDGRMDKKEKAYKPRPFEWVALRSPKETMLLRMVILSEAIGQKLIYIDDIKAVEKPDSSGKPLERFPCKLPEYGIEMTNAIHLGEKEIGFNIDYYQLPPIPAGEEKQLIEGLKKPLKISGKTMGK